MAVYVPIPDTEIAPEEPVTSDLYHKFRDNPLAIAEGDPSAQSVSFTAIGITAGNIATSYPEDMGPVPEGGALAKTGPGVLCGGVIGTIRIKYSVQVLSAGLIISQLRFNGADIGPENLWDYTTKGEFTHDYTLTAPGIIELYSYIIGSGGVAGELAIYTTGTLQFIRENVNSGL